MGNAKFFLSEVYISIIRNPLMSVAAFSTMGLSIFVLGFFLLIIGNLNFIATVLISQVEVTVFLEDGISKTNINDVKNIISSYPSVKEVRFVSKDEALKRLEQRLKGNLPVKKNPLLNSLEVTLNEPESITTVAAKAEKLSGVHHVKYGKKEMQKLTKFSGVVNIFGISVIILMTAVTMLIVMNTIRLTILARQKEIEIMQLVGATRWFIRWPFIMEGILYGFFGSLLSVIVLNIMYGSFASWMLASLPFVPIIPSLSILMIFFLLFMGVIMGFIASTLSVSRFLKI